MSLGGIPMTGRVESRGLGFMNGRPQSRSLLQAATGTAISTEVSLTSRPLTNHGLGYNSTLNTTRQNKDLTYHVALLRNRLSFLNSEYRRSKARLQNVLRLEKSCIKTGSEVSVYRQEITELQTSMRDCIEAQRVLKEGRSVEDCRQMAVEAEKAADAARKQADNIYRIKLVSEEKLAINEQKVNQRRQRAGELISTEIGPQAAELYVKKLSENISLRAKLTNETAKLRVEEQKLEKMRENIYSVLLFAGEEDDEGLYGELCRFLGVESPNGGTSSSANLEDGIDNSNNNSSGKGVSAGNGNSSSNTSTNVPKNVVEAILMIYERLKSKTDRVEKFRLKRDALKIEAANAKKEDCVESEALKEKFAAKDGLHKAKNSFREFYSDTKRTVEVLKGLEANISLRRDSFTQNAENTDTQVSLGENQINSITGIRKLVALNQSAEQQKAETKAVNAKLETEIEYLVAALPIMSSKSQKLAQSEYEARIMNGISGNSSGDGQGAINGIDNGVNRQDAMAVPGTQQSGQNGLSSNNNIAQNRMGGQLPMQIGVRDMTPQSLAEIYAQKQAELAKLKQFEPRVADELKELIKKNQQTQKIIDNLRITLAASGTQIGAMPLAQQDSGIDSIINTDNEELLRTRIAEFKKIHDQKRAELKEASQNLVELEGMINADPSVHTLRSLYHNYQNWLQKRVITENTIATRVRDNDYSSVKKKVLDSISNSRV